MGDSKPYKIKASPVGQYASRLEATWALHLRSLCDSVEYSGTKNQSFDFLVESGGRKLAIEIKPRFNQDNSEDEFGVPSIVYQAASRAYRKQVEQISHHGLTATLIATGFPENSKWYLVLCESDDRRYRHRHMRKSKLWSDDIHSRSGSDYTIYIFDSEPEFGEELLSWLNNAVNMHCTNYVSVFDPEPVALQAQGIVSDKQKRKLQNRARHASRLADSHLKR